LEEERVAETFCWLVSWFTS